MLLGMANAAGRLASLRFAAPWSRSANLRRPGGESCGPDASSTSANGLTTETLTTTGSCCVNPVITETPLDYGAHHAVPDRVLMFAYIFPPLAGGGVQRTVKYVKYLPLHGFSSVVVTSRPRSIPVARDDRMLAEIPAGTVVVRARTVPIHRVQYKFDGALRRLGLPTAVARASMWPDEWIGWLPAAVWHGVRAVKKHRPRVIFSTSPMVTAHLAALIVHRLTGVPWVADFRDGWALDPGPAWSSVAPPRPVMESFERQFVADAIRTTVA